MFHNTPIDAVIEILQYLPLTDLINMVKVTKLMENIITKTPWFNLIVKLNENNLEFVLGKYNFKKINLSCSKITNASVKLLGSCHTLNLSWCNLITDDLKIELRKTVKKLCI